MPTPYESARLNLRLYDLRREPVLREARAWFLGEFSPESFAELVAVAGGARNAAFRMVLGYWDMAASLVTCRAIDADAFRAAHGEAFLTFAKVHPFLAELRAATGEPDFCRHLEAVVLGAPDALATLERRGTAARAAAARRGERPSRTAPAILVVVGASGAGKTTLVERLAQLALPGVACHHFDAIGVPSAEEIAGRFGSGEAFQAWGLDRWMARLTREPAATLDVLDAQVRPSAVRDAFARHAVARGTTVLVDCGHDVRNARLRGPRGQPELATPEMDGWAAYLRGQADALGVPVVDTTRATVAASLSELRGHVAALLGGAPPSNGVAQGAPA